MTHARAEEREGSASSELERARSELAILERRCRGLEKTHRRDKEFWAATNHNLRIAYARLDRTDARLARAQRLARIGDWELDLANHEVSLSEALKDILGVNVSGFGGALDDLLNLVHRADRMACEHCIEQAVRTGQSFDLEHRIVTAAGVKRWVRHQGVAITDATSRPIRVYGAIQDISERIDNEARLRLDARVFEHLEEGIVILDAEGRIVEVNRAFTEITGFRASEVTGSELGRMYRELDVPTPFEAVSSGLGERGHWQGEILARRKDGSVYPQWLTVAFVRDAGGVITNGIASFSDITVLKAAQDRLEHLAYYDGVTGLPNRRLLVDRLESAVHQAQRADNQLAVLFIDLDDFKAINDSLGHAAGDRMLAAVASRLSACVRKSDTVGRLGGDEFAMVLTNISDAGAAEEHARRVVKALAPPLPFDEREVYVSASVGVVVGPTADDTAQDMLVRADKAMYEVKHRGKSGVHVFTDAVTKERINAVDVAAHLRRATDNGDLFLVFQPQLEIPTGRVIGVEALMRCRSASWGTLMPSEFIPIAERTGLIRPLGSWAILEACTRAAEWQAAGCARVPVAVNVSAHQFNDPSLLRTVTHALDQTGLDARWLELELTESLLLNATPRLMETFGALRALGVRLTIDDFGTGFSALALLPTLPLQRLKMDRSFLTGIASPSDPRSRLVSAVIALSESLDLELVVEGVETQQQHELVKAKGARIGQGYLYSRPVGPERIAQLLRATSPAAAIAPGMSGPG